VNSGYSGGSTPMPDAVYAMVLGTSAYLTH
jgi:hypothetical protein